MQMTLVSAVFGMGNTNHQHVHRHNTLEIDPQHIDRLSMEQHNGGVLPSTLTEVSFSAGGISSRPQGMVNIEDGWNVRRGIGMLKFIVENNAMSSSELAVLGYLTGGAATTEGVSSDTMFVPVRSWKINTRNTTDMLGMPTASTVVSDSSQFLLGDPFGINKLQALRPVDVGNETLGYFACADDGVDLDNYGGLLGSDLSTTLAVSKTNNLNPSHHARELLKVATAVSGPASSMGIENALSGGMSNLGMREISPSQNEFFQAMMVANGMQMFTGFCGWSVGEIAGVFTNLSEVLNLDLLNETVFANQDNIFSSMENGASNMHEITASELAFMTVHLLMQCGLTHLTFSATNNPHHIGGIVGSEGGVEIITGEFGSVLDNDDHAINRVESFKELLKSNFFSKYNTGYEHTSTLIDVIVSCSIFGETSVEISVGEKEARRYVNATYCINRTSTNIAGLQAGLSEARNFMANIRDYFNQN